MPTDKARSTAQRPMSKKRPSNTSARNRWTWLSRTCSEGAPLQCATSVRTELLKQKIMLLTHWVVKRRSIDHLDLQTVHLQVLSFAYHTFRMSNILSTCYTKC